MNIYEEIIKLCKLRNITIDELMKKIGKTSAIYYGWRARDMMPRADDLYNICKVLNVSMEHFFDNDDDNYIVPVNIKSLVQKLENLSTEDLEILKNLSPEQLQNMIALCKSIKN